MLINENKIEFDEVSPQSVYLFLYNEIMIKHKQFFLECSKRDVSKTISMPSGKGYDELTALLSSVCEKYGLRLRINYEQLYLWQTCFLKEKSDDAILAASYLVQACILADHILDSPDFTKKQKEAVCRKINWNSGMGESENEFPELSLLFTGFRDYFEKQKEDPLLNEALLYQMIQKAIDSEIYMYESKLDFFEDMEDENLFLLIDKSVEFEKAVFITALYGNNTEESIVAAGILGKIFWLVDDLCDFMDDVKAGRKNSLLLYCADRTNYITFEQRLRSVFANLNLAVEELETSLESLREYVSEEFFDFLILQIWKWFEPVKNVVLEHI